MTDAAMLAAAPRAFLEAPAGCGKTHLISEAVCHHGTRRDLVLTHTHAGVDALRRKIRSLGGGPTKFVVDTIASWALKYARAFPQTSGLRTPLPTKDEWDNVYEAARKVLLRGTVREVVRASYSGAYVDEYQDCTVQQHALILAIADAIPLRLLGDPLQGIFDFGRNQPVRWDRDVRGAFPELPALTRPWRWEGKNPQLGQWLASIRNDILQRHDFTLYGSPVHWKRLPPTNAIAGQVGECLQIAKGNPGTVVAIHGMPEQCHYVASRLNGLYQCVEPIESQDLFESGGRIQGSHGCVRAAEIIDFAAKCMTRIGTVLDRVRSCYRSGSVPNTRQGQLSAVHDALREVARNDSLSAVVSALESLQSVPKSIMYRRELFNEMIRGLRTAMAKNQPLDEALWEVRNQTRFSGRRLSRCVVGSTLLVKGLEFDHAVILAADEMDAKDLYVAMTRGALSLTVFSKSQTLSPR